MLLIKVIYWKMLEFEREYGGITIELWFVYGHEFKESLILTDPRTAHLPVVASLTYTLALIGLYLLTVLKLGPAFMSNRKPFEIKRILQIYNVLQIATNVYIISQVRICICSDLSKNLRKLFMKLISGCFAGSSSEVLTINPI